MKQFIEITEIDAPACGDGCCHEAVTKIYVNGELIASITWARDYQIIQAILEHFKIDADVKSN